MRWRQRLRGRRAPPATPWPGSAATSSWSCCEDLDGAACRASTSPSGWSPPCASRWSSATPSTFASASIGIALADERATPDPRLSSATPTRRCTAPRSEDAARYELFDESLRRRVIVRCAPRASCVGPSSATSSVVHYQPIVDASRPVRSPPWRRWCAGCTLSAGCWSPIDFIHVAEETGLIAPLGDVVLRTACRDVADWQRRFDGEPPVMLCVNASATQLADTAFPARGCRDRAGAAGSQPARWPSRSPRASWSTKRTLAVTVLNAHARLRARADGIDDFGTGYSGAQLPPAIPARRAQDRSLLHRRPRARMSEDSCDRRRHHRHGARARARRWWPRALRTASSSRC